MNRKWLPALPGVTAVIVFNIIFYLTGGVKRPAGVWIAYAFIHIACAVLLFTAAVLSGREKDAVLAVPLNMIGNIYFIAAFLVSVGFILILPGSVKGCVIAQVVLLGIYLAVLMVHLAVSRTTGAQEEIHRADMYFVRDCSSRMRALMESAGDRESAGKLENVYDFLHASPVKSEDSVTEHELEIIRLIGELEKSGLVRQPDRLDPVLEKIMFHAQERNRILKDGRG